MGGPLPTNLAKHGLSPGMSRQDPKSLVQIHLDVAGAFAVPERQNRCPRSGDHLQLSSELEDRARLQIAGSESSVKIVGI